MANFLKERQAMKEEREIPINMTDVFAALAQSDLLRAADMRDLEDRARELGERSSQMLSPEVDGGEQGGR